MADTGDQRAVIVLIDLLKDDKTMTARGTLVYALSHFECSEYYPQLYKLVATDAFEAANEAAMILSDIVSSLESSEELTLHNQEVEKYLYLSEGENKEILLDIKSLISKKLNS